MALKNKTKTTNPPVFLKVYGVEALTKKLINMHIGHDRSVGLGVCFAKETRPRIGE